MKLEPQKTHSIPNSEIVVAEFRLIPENEVDQKWLAELEEGGLLDGAEWTDREHTKFVEAYAHIV